MRSYVRTTSILHASGASLIASGGTNISIRLLHKATFDKTLNGMQGDPPPQKKKFAPHFLRLRFIFYFQNEYAYFLPTLLSERDFPCQLQPPVSSHAEHQS